MRDLTKALLSLYPTAKWALDGDTYSGLMWMSDDVSVPTEDELNAEYDRLQAEHEAKEYRRQRITEYPPIGDQLDALWKGGDAAAEMLATVMAVKAKYPKPE